MARLRVGKPVGDMEGNYAKRRTSLVKRPNDMSIQCDKKFQSVTVGPSGEPSIARSDLIRFLDPDFIVSTEEDREGMMKAYEALKKMKAETVAHRLEMEEEKKEAINVAVEDTAGCSGKPVRDMKGYYAKRYPSLVKRLNDMFSSSGEPFVSPSDCSDLIRFMDPDFLASSNDLEGMKKFSEALDKFNADMEEDAQRLAREIREIEVSIVAVEDTAGCSANDMDESA